VESYCVMEAIKTIDRCDVAILVVDGTAGLKTQDEKIASLIEEGWLNDEEMAKRFVEREKQKGYGAKMIALKLKEKGDFLKVAIEESKEAVRDLVAKRYLKQLPDRRPQVIAALMRRGLPYELILEVLETFSGDWYKES